jgi:hypothetical protein
MTPLNYLTIVTSLFSVVVGVHLVARPLSVGWQPRTTRIVGATMAIIAFVTATLTFMQSHGKA